MTKYILIVDAEIGFTLPLKKALEEAGEYEVRAVTRLMPAVNALQEQRYDVAVLDARLDQVHTAELVYQLRQVQPDLPVILTSFYAEDEELTIPLQAQWFLQKRYVARTLIPIIEATVAQGYSPHTAETRSNASIEPIEPLLEMSRANPMLTEPPITLYDSTIGEVIDQALNPEVSQRIQAQIEPLPDEPTAMLSNRPPLPDPDQEENYDSPATAALAAVELDTEQDEHESQPISGLPSLNQLLAMLPPPPDNMTDLIRIEPPPTDEDTRYTSIPRPPELPDQQWFDQVLPPTTLPEIEPEPPPVAEHITDEPLYTTSIDEITQQLMAVEQESVDEVMENAAAQAITPARALAHYAVQLTQFSLESSAQGILLSRGSEILAKAGSFDEAAWTQIMQQVVEAWSRPGDARTRVIYRRLTVGELLLYSVLTVDEQTLTLVFAADTPLKLIRRQAARLVESLLSVPDMTQPFQPIAPESESRLPPGEAKERVHEPEPMPRESAPPPPVEPEKPRPETPLDIPVKPVDRGGYIHYACVWLLEDDSEPMSRALIVSLGEWLKDICIAQEWDFEHGVVEPDWIWLKLHVPAETLPNEIAELLMDKSAHLILQVEPQRRKTPLWSDGYLIVTPAQQMDHTTIDRFIRFYRREKLRS